MGCDRYSGAKDVRDNVSGAVFFHLVTGDCFCHQAGLIRPPDSDVEAGRARDDKRRSEQPSRYKTLHGIPVLTA
jgi:hypothetical protein